MSQSSTGAGRTRPLASVRRPAILPGSTALRHHPIFHNTSFAHPATPGNPRVSAVLRGYCDAQRMLRRRYARLACGPGWLALHCGGSPLRATRCRLGSLPARVGAPWSPPPSSPPRGSCAPDPGRVSGVPPARSDARCLSGGRRFLAAGSAPHRLPAGPTGVACALRALQSRIKASPHAAR